MVREGGSWFVGGGVSVPVIRRRQRGRRADFADRCVQTLKKRKKAMRALIPFLLVQQRQEAQMGLRPILVLSRLLRAADYFWIIVSVYDRY